MSEQSDRAAAYRAKATDLRKLAETPLTIDLRRTALDLADQWDQVADQLESVARFRKMDGA
jgi:hypothetical protein